MTETCSWPVGNCQCDADPSAELRDRVTWLEGEVFRLEGEVGALKSETDRLQWDLDVATADPDR